MKRLVLSVVCALFALLTLCALCETSGDFEYTLSEDGTAVITSYFGNDTVLNIPEELDGHSVSGIGDEAFYCCTSLTEVTIPDSVTAIAYDAFYDCPNLIATVGRNSYAEQFCLDNDINYTYVEILDWLND